MLDVAPTELLMVALVALVVIGPKDLPKAMRFVGRWVGKAQGVARHFRSGLDEMVRQAELEDMERKWAEENARIMCEHPADPHTPSWDETPPDTTPPPVMTPLTRPDEGAEADDIEAPDRVPPASEPRLPFDDAPREARS